MFFPRHSGVQSISNAMLETTETVFGVSIALGTIVNPPKKSAPRFA